MPTLPKYNVLKKVETIEISRGSTKVIQDGSDNKGTLNSINSNSMEIGTIAPGEISGTKIIYLSVSKGIVINNINIALIDTGGISFANNIFGIEILSYLDYNMVPNIYFQGVNNNKSSSSIYNIPVKNNGNLKSEYVYLNVSLPREHIIGQCGTVRYKWFFDFAS